MPHHWHGLPGHESLTGERFWGALNERFGTPLSIVFAESADTKSSQKRLKYEKSDMGSFLFLPVLSK